MIKYELECENGHGFQGHFSGICSAKRQLAEGRVECIACGTKKVSKAQVASAKYRKKDIQLDMAEVVTQEQKDKFDKVLDTIEATLGQSRRAFDA